MEICENLFYNNIFLIQKWTQKKKKNNPQKSVRATILLTIIPSELSIHLEVPLESTLRKYLLHPGIQTRSV